MSKCFVRWETLHDFESSIAEEELENTVIASYSKPHSLRYCFINVASFDPSKIAWYSPSQMDVQMWGRHLHLKAMSPPSMNVIKPYDDAKPG